MMHFGVCVGLPHAREALAAGFEFVEIPAQVFKGTDDIYDPDTTKGIPTPVTNFFFPGGMKLFGAERGAYSDYARKVLDRAAKSGVKVMVIGSGSTRRAPDGYNEDAAFDSFIEIVAEIEKRAKKMGIHLAPESLTRADTNVGNDLAVLAKALKSKGVGFTANSYHILAEWDADGRERGKAFPSDAFWKKKIPHLPTHVHLADFSRSFPRADDLMIKGFVKRLQALHYKGRVSLECRLSDYGKELPAALAELKKIFKVGEAKKPALAASKSK